VVAELLAAERQRETVKIGLVEHLGSLRIELAQTPATHPCSERREVQ
jgi:hypothetical protein